VGEYLEGLKIALFCIVYFINLLVHASAVGTHFAFRGQRPAIKASFYSIPRKHRTLPAGFSAVAFPTGVFVCANG